MLRGFIAQLLATEYSEVDRWVGDWACKRTNRRTSPRVGVGKTAPHRQMRVAKGY